MVLLLKRFEEVLNNDAEWQRRLTQNFMIKLKIITRGLQDKKRLPQ
jgi:hypothetical protein